MLVISYDFHQRWNLWSAYMYNDNLRYVIDTLVTLESILEQVEFASRRLTTEAYGMCGDDIAHILYFISGWQRRALDGRKSSCRALDGDRGGLDRYRLQQTTTSWHIYESFGLCFLDYTRDTIRSMMEESTNMSFHLDAQFRLIRTNLIRVDD